MSGFRFITPGSTVPRRDPAAVGGSGAPAPAAARPSAGRGQPRDAGTPVGRSSSAAATPRADEELREAEKAEKEAAVRSLARFDWNSVVLPSSPSGPVDSVLAAAVIALIGFGTVMVYSASVIEIRKMVTKDPEFYVVRQAIYGFLALFTLWGVSRIDYRKLRVLSKPVVLVVGALLAATLVIGRSAGNAQRWLKLGPINIQASEMAKLGVVLWLSYSLSRKRDHIRYFWFGFLPDVLLIAVLAVLCYFQPDLGSALVLGTLSFTLLFLAGTPMKYLLGTGLVVGVLGVLGVLGKAYRINRVLAWFDILGARDGSSYQPYQSVLSFGSGGVWGQGLGKGLQILYLPEAHTDFISAIVGEELGFVGILGLCVAYAIVVFRGIKIALSAHDDYGTFLAYGISALFALQALVNLCVAMALVPTKGLTLPFLSFGGSSLLVNAAAVGILLNISRPRRPVAAPPPAEPAAAGPAPSATAVVLESANQRGSR